MNRHEWEPVYRNLFRPVGFGPLVLVLGAVAAGLGIAVRAAWDGHLRVIGYVCVAALVAGLARLRLWRRRHLERAGVFVGDEGVRMTAVLTDEVIPWRDIAGFRIQPWGPLYPVGPRRGLIRGVSDAIWIITNDGREIPTWIRTVRRFGLPRPGTTGKALDRLNGEIRRRSTAGVVDAY